MKIISAKEVDSLLDFPALIAALRDAFTGGVKAPVRHHHTIERKEGSDSTMLLMPAWSDFSAGGVEGNGFTGVKIVSVSPDNNAVGLPAVMGVYLLSDGTTCAPLALIDGQKLTLWRTAAASALVALESLTKRTSSRRATASMRWARPLNRPMDRTATAGATPSVITAARAAQAFWALWTPLNASIWAISPASPVFPSIR